jgi:hypothetical protein
MLKHTIAEKFKETYFWGLYVYPWLVQNTATGQGRDNIFMNDVNM